MPAEKPRRIALIAMPRQKLRHLSFDRLRQQRTGPFAQHFRQRVTNLVRHRWILQRKNVIVTHGVFTPCKRSMIPEKPSRIRLPLNSRHPQLSSIAHLIIVDTDDALLVARRDQTQKVREAVETLKQRGDPSYRLHRTVHRPWGTYTVLDHGPGFKIKRIVVRPKAALSLQLHRHRSEHWVVVSGTAEVVNGDRRLTVKANESTFIPVGSKHRLSNPGDEDVVIIEVQSGTYVEEDDIVRFDDDYGRR